MDQVDRILAASLEPQRSMFLLLVDTGMRISELIWLTWDDVDFGRNLIHIREKDDWKPKSGDQRAVPMTDRVRAMLESRPRRHRWVFNAGRSAKYPKGDGQISERRLLASLKRVLKSLGLKGHLHTFRHTFISHALTIGTAEAVVRQWVGHVDAEILKHYTHIADVASQAAMRRLSASDQPSRQSGGLEAGKEAGSESAQNKHSDGEGEINASAK